jgi:uncharacterized PurR-regulated membrane protein YhhQ (DUF165 family)
MFARFAVAVAAMVVVVTASNILVQYPVEAMLGPIHLGDILTWGAFTYPFAFLVSDLTNRQAGPKRARQVVLIGFVVALGLSAVLATPRIAIASASAFLFGQLLDISVFQRLRNRFWVLPPLGGIDLAFGMADGSLGFGAPWLGIGSEVPLWLSLASGDFAVKFLAALLLLAPYRLLMGAVLPPRPATV